MYLGILGMHPYADMEDSELDHECQKMLINMMLMERKKAELSCGGNAASAQCAYVFSLPGDVLHLLRRQWLVTK